MLDHDVSQDNGSTVSQGINSLIKYGVCSEQNYPYDITKFADKPPHHCYLAAKSHEVVTSVAVACNGNAIKQALAAGYPIVVGITVYPQLESQETASTGICANPQPGDQPIGGHCVVICGFDDSKQMYCIRNSWGTSWGQNGYFWISYSYINNSNICSDLHIIKKVEL
jgi:C1A family cysteine protease